MLSEERSVVSGCRYLAVDLDQAADEVGALPVNLTDQVVWQPNTTVIAFSRWPVESLPAQTRKLLPFFDVVADSNVREELLHSALENLQSHPLASTALIQLLRKNGQLSVEDGLMLESLTYSTLQHGAEFIAWLNGRTAPGRNPSPPMHPVNTRRDGDDLTITLNRRDKHNAFSAAMRDALCEALSLAEADHSIERVILQGAGPSFCAGGDLDEFGLARDAALAHLTRTTRSPARLINRIARRTTVRLQGACIGAGIEMTAFAGHVVAATDAYFALPEVGFGLVPGAGGTVSIPRRIGHHRTALWALSGQRIGAALALAWGLVDEIAEQSDFS